MKRNCKNKLFRVIAMTGIMALTLSQIGACGNKTEDETSGEETLPSESIIDDETTVDTSFDIQESETESVTETETTTTIGPDSFDVDEGYEKCWQIVQATTDVNVRTGASSSCDTIGLLKKGDRIQRFAIDPSWSQVVYAGQVFYVATQYLEVVSEDTSLTADAVLDTSNATITIDGLTPNTGEQTVPAETTAPASISETTVPAETTTSSTAEEIQPSGLKTYTWDEILNLDNTTIPFGTSANDRDADNIPNGIYYYQNLYGQYGGDYLAPKTNTIYLTMDEGYEAGYTPEILDTLKEKNVKAVFFVTKQFVTEHPELVQRMIDEGHVIGNHTCAHPSDGMPSLGAEAERDDIMWLHNYVLENFGYEMHLFRFPTGAFSIQSLALVRSLGYTPVFWSYAHNDWSLTDQPDEATALQNTLDQLHPGAIYLLHAVSSTNTHNMAAWIDGVRERGYDFGVYPTYGFNY